MKRILILTVVALGVIGCLSMKENNSVSGGLGFSGKQQTTSYEVIHEEYALSDDFPKTKLSLSFRVKIHDDQDLKKAKKTVEENDPNINHWLILYIADQTTENFHGSKNLLARADEIRDGLNMLLWGSKTGKIKAVLFQDITFSRMMDPKPRYSY